MSEWSGGAAASEVEIVRARPVGPRRLLASTVAVVLAAGIVAAVVAQTSGGGRTAEERLAAAQAFVAGVESYRFESLMTEVMGSPDDLGPGSSSTMRTRSRVAIAGPDTWHAVSDSGDWADETIQVGELMWERYADGVDGLAAEQWVQLPADAYELSEDDRVELMGEIDDLGLAAAFGAFWFGDDPAATVEVITRATDPVVLAEGPEGVTLQLRAPEVPELDGLDVDVELQLDLDRDDVPRALRVSTATEDTTFDLDVTFTAWDVEVEVSPPADDEIDRTPWIDEDALRAYDASAVYLPVALPDGYELSTVDVWEADEDWSECAQVVLHFGVVPSEPLDGDAWEDELEAWMEEYLSVTSASSDCAGEASIELFGGGRSREVSLGDTTVLLESSVEAEVFEAVVASLVPADVDALIEQFNVRQAELEELGLGMGGAWVGLGP